jgi:hypothetical protein
MEQLRSWFEAQQGGREPAIEAISRLTETDPSDEASEAFWALFEKNLRDRGYG